MIKFIITGLPRSGTTWLSVFLSTDDCLCLHDPYGTHTPEELGQWEGGVCDTALWYYADWCRVHTDKFIIIDRKVEEVNSSLINLDIVQVPEEFTNIFNNTDSNKRIYFEDLFTEEIAEELWNYIYPEKPFNVIRWKMLKDIHMEPTEDILSKYRQGE